MMSLKFIRVRFSFLFKNGELYGCMFRYQKEKSVTNELTAESYNKKKIANIKSIIEEYLMWQ